MTRLPVAAAKYYQKKISYYVEAIRKIVPP